MSNESEVPVQLLPGFSIDSTSFAATGSDTAQNTTGISAEAFLTAEYAAAADGVAIAMITSYSPEEAILAA